MLLAKCLGFSRIHSGDRRLLQTVLGICETDSRLGRTLVTPLLLVAPLHGRSRENEEACSCMCNGRIE